MKTLLLTLTAIACLTTESAADDLESWQSIELGQSGELTVRLRVKEQASLADEEWIAIEFENRGGDDLQIEAAHYHTRSERYDLQTRELVSSGSLASGNDHALFPQAWKSTPVSPRVVKPGVYRMIDHPSLYSSALLGLPKENGLLVKAEISVRMRVHDELVQLKGREFQFQWLYPTAAGFDRMRARLKRLLAHPRDEVQHAYILHTLLEIPAVAQAVSVPELLDAIPQRTHSFSGREYVLSHLNDHYTDDKLVVDYFLKRLIAGDQRITSDLRRAHKLWQPEFLEPLIKRLETERASIGDVMEILRQRGSPQKNDAKLAERLSSSLPWYNANDPDRPADPFLIGETLKLMGMTHDRKMVPNLAPYLHDKRTTLDPQHLATFDFRLPPLRVCDHALEAILNILDGGPDVAYKQAGFEIRDAGRGHVKTTADEITEIRDKMIAKLKQRLADR